MGSECAIGCYFRKARAAGMSRAAYGIMGKPSKKAEQSDWKKYARTTWFYILILLLGAAIMLYPLISNMWNEHVFRTDVVSYENAVEQFKGDLETEYDTAVAYNLGLIPKEVPDSFAIRDGIEDKEYEEILDVDGTGMMGYISIPVIDVELPIYHYTTKDVLKKGVGHLLGSSLPVGGEGTHAVLSAHRGLPSAKLFTDLNLLAEGDRFYIHILDHTLTYEVDQIKVVEPDQTEALAPVPGKDYVTLVTCTPYGVNTQRLLVRGHRVPNEEKEQTIAAKRWDFTRLYTIILCFILGILLAFIVSKVMLIRKRRKPNDKNEK